MGALPMVGKAPILTCFRLPAADGAAEVLATAGLALAVARVGAAEVAGAVLAAGFDDAGAAETGAEDAGVAAGELAGAEDPPPQPASKTLMATMAEARLMLFITTMVRQLRRGSDRCRTRRPKPGPRSRMLAGPA